ncbi:peptidylprolyl isomerase [Candidatus Pelagibacter sp. Uisw_113]|uniref:peptidylprolyl isomerase n=1 Tax=Candidatus Pelagibacter sp. Uisw_113 TaxID=3230994 RepID=UPI0039ED7EC2
MKKISVFLILIITLLLSETSYSYENFIIHKINNEIITEYDVKKEANYLRALNPNLKNLDILKLTKLALNSIVREKIKKIELEKNNSLGENLDDPMVLSTFESVYKNIGIKNEDEFEQYLKKFNISIKWTKMKLEIESLWNSLIYNKYRNQVSIDKEEIRKSLKKDIKLRKTQKKILLSEIVIKFNSNQDFLSLTKMIEESIAEIGFSNTANTHSISGSANKGGKIGWINQTSLSPKILTEIKDLVNGEYTKPIKIDSNFLILKIEDSVITNVQIDLEEALNKRILNERNKQLDQFSTIFFNRVKKNIIIDG